MKPGYIHGATDKKAAYPTRDPVSPGDRVATIYHLLGIDPNLIIHDCLSRPYSISHGGEPIQAVLA